MPITPNLSNLAEEAIYNGTAEIAVVGKGNYFELHVKHEYVEVEGKYHIYTDAFRRAIHIVNEVG